ncbi:hypothetical protein COP1_025995 [Malus domestica]
MEEPQTQNVKRRRVESEEQGWIHSGVVGVARPLGNHGNNLEAPIRDLLELGSSGSSGSESHAKCSTKILNEARHCRKRKKKLRASFFSKHTGKTASFWPRKFF